MEFKDGFWTARGDAATTVLNPAHQAIIETLRTAGYPMTPTQLATVLHVNLNTMKVHLMRLVDRGLVCKNGQGQYTHRIISPETTLGVTPVTCVPDAEHRGTPAPGPLPVETFSEPTTPRQETPRIEDESQETPSVEVTVTQVTPDVPGAPTPPATNGTHHALAPAEVPPQFCPGCGEQVCWLERSDYYECSRRGCGAKVPKTPGTSHG